MFSCDFYGLFDFVSVPSNIFLTVSQDVPAVRQVGTACSSVSLSGAELSVPVCARRLVEACQLFFGGRRPVAYDRVLTMRCSSSWSRAERCCCSETFLLLAVPVRRRVFFLPDALSEHDVK